MILLHYLYIFREKTQQINSIKELKECSDNNVGLLRYMNQIFKLLREELTYSAFSIDGLHKQIKEGLDKDKDDMIKFKEEFYSELYKNIKEIKADTNNTLLSYFNNLKDELKIYLKEELDAVIEKKLGNKGEMAYFSH